jgi:hypothetical protein
MLERAEALSEVEGEVFQGGALYPSPRQGRGPTIRPGES